METLRTLLTQFTDETIGILLGVLVLLFAILIAYWLYNRRKFRELSHQIPASVVKNYLDSIIANSTALKSSLFRGGGLELGEGIPSVFPTGSLPAGGVSAGGDSSEELAQKNAEISSLRSQVQQKDQTIADLEKMLAAARESNGGGVSDEEANLLRGENDKLKSEIEDLKNQLAAAAEAGGGGGGDAELIKERDELKERLMEYEIIEEDLANLKRFQQENAELKKTIEALKAGGGAPAAEPAAEAPAAEPAPAPEPAAEEAPAPAPEPEPTPAEPPPPEVTAAENSAADDSATQEAAAEMDVPSNDGEQKSAEELLSEFEKMLG